MPEEKRKDRLSDPDQLWRTTDIRWADALIKCYLAENGYSGISKVSISTKEVQFWCPTTFARADMVFLHHRERAILACVENVLQMPTPSKRRAAWNIHYWFAKKRKDAVLRVPVDFCLISGRGHLSTVLAADVPDLRPENVAAQVPGVATEELLKVLAAGVLEFTHNSRKIVRDTFSSVPHTDKLAPLELFPKCKKLFACKFNGHCYRRLLTQEK